MVPAWGREGICSQWSWPGVGKGYVVNGPGLGKGREGICSQWSRPGEGKGYVVNGPGLG